MGLREAVRLFKALYGISYAKIAKELQINPSSFYNWLSGTYEFGQERQEQLKAIIRHYQEESND